MLEPPGWLSLLWYVSCSKLVVSLMAQAGNFVVRKTCENYPFFIFLFFFAPFWFLEKTLKHRCRFDLCQMYNSPDTSGICFKTTSRGHCAASFYWSPRKKVRHAQLNAINFCHDIQVLPLGAFWCLWSPEGFSTWGWGAPQSLSLFLLLHCFCIIDHRWSPETERDSDSDSGKILFIPEGQLGRWRGERCNFSYG